MKRCASGFTAWLSSRRSIVPLLIAVCCVGLLGGCQLQPVSSGKLLIHQSYIDLDGLSSIGPVTELKVTWAIPKKWDKLPRGHSLLYTHQQWRSPSLHAGVGVAYIHTPIPISANMIIWFAKNEYIKSDGKDPQGRLIGEWNDSLGRHWFEAENSIYHVKGYAMTKGTDAWIVYSGYRVKTRPKDAEIALAAKSADSVVPMTTDPAPEATSSAAQK